MHGNEPQKYYPPIGPDLSAKDERHDYGIDLYVGLILKP